MMLNYAFISTANMFTCDSGTVMNVFFLVVIVRPSDPILSSKPNIVFLAFLNYEIREIITALCTGLWNTVLFHRKCKVILCFIPS